MCKSTRLWLYVSALQLSWCKHVTIPSILISRSSHSASQKFDPHWRYIISLGATLTSILPRRNTTRTLPFYYEAARYDDFSRSNSVLGPWYLMLCRRFWIQPPSRADTILPWGSKPYTTHFSDVSFLLVKEDNQLLVCSKPSSLSVCLSLFLESSTL